MSAEQVLPIVGDVVAVDDANITLKGGSMTATIRKSVRAGLGDVTGHLGAAALRFGEGPTVVLLSGSPAEAQAVRVRRINDTTFELRLDAGRAVEADDLTAAFLRLKLAQFKRGELELAPPVDAAGWRAENAALEAEVEAEFETDARPEGRSG